MDETIPETVMECFLTLMAAAIAGAFVGSVMCVLLHLPDPKVLALAFVLAPLSALIDFFRHLRKATGVRTATVLALADAVGVFAGVMLALLIA